MPKTTPKVKTMVVDGKEMAVITPERIQEHEVVSFAANEALKLHEHIAKVKEAITQKVQDLLEKTAHLYGESWKGNAHLFDLNENFKVLVKVFPKVKFTKEIAVAMQKYDAWIDNLMGEHEIKDLVKKTFKTDSEGNIPKGRIMSLLNYESDNPQKKEADEIVKKAIRKEIRKPYYTFYQKDGEIWSRIEINFSEI